MASLEEEVRRINAIANDAFTQLLSEFHRVRRKFGQRTTTLLGLFQPQVGKLVATAEATVGRTAPMIASLGQSPWQLDLEQLIDAFGPATMLSYDFLSNLRDLGAGAACSWQDALHALQLARRARQCNHSMHPGASTSQDWCPMDVKRAAEALNVQGGKLAKRRVKEPKEGLHPHKRRKTEAARLEPESSPEVGRGVSSAELDDGVGDFLGTNDDDGDGGDSEADVTPSTSSVRRTPVLTQSVEEMPGNLLSPRASDSDETLGDAPQLFGEEASHLHSIPSTPQKRRTPALDDTLNSSGEEPSHPHQRLDITPSRVQQWIETPFKPRKLLTYPQVPPQPRASFLPLPQLTVSEETTSKTSEEATAEETAAKDTIAKETIAKETIAKETIAKETIAKETSAKETSTKDTSTKEISAEEMTAEEMTAEEMTAEEMTAKETTSQEMAVTISKEITRAHWALLSLDLCKRHATVYDSIATKQDAMQPAAEAIVSAFGLDWAKEGWKLIRHPEAIQQQNTHDCGLLTLVTCFYNAAGTTLPKGVDTQLWRTLLRTALEAEHLDSTSFEHSLIARQDDAPRGAATPFETLIPTHRAAKAEQSRLRTVRGHLEEMRKVVSVLLADTSSQADHAAAECADMEADMHRRARRLESLRSNALAAALPEDREAERLIHMAAEQATVHMSNLRKTRGHVQARQSFLGTLLAAAHRMRGGLDERWERGEAELERLKERMDEAVGLLRQIEVYRREGS
ncbi:putative ubiquitin-like protein-specific protease protein [Neofusicoccum parvum UCRNP2]|uniref:Putative ubiquitin-like protein-specific protease protein n=1 Tax=Botryosphaeria parva (strain UCR-NP2) TaxID=1287680 RepID=R1GZ89_BOTPV|nr:putative ubiquitin-like protein-specific protease protein [Neofusicoccum parvum UCRNP2]